MTRILATAQREFRQFYRDKLTLFIAFGLPFVLITLYGTALTMNVRNLRLAVEDLDQTPFSRRYVEAYAATNKFILVPPSGPVEQMVESARARAALRIPPGFERDLKRGRAPQVQLLIDGTESNAALLLRGIHSMIPLTLDPIAPRVALHVRHWYNPGLNDHLFFGSGALGLVLILFPALLGALSASREKELGTITLAYAARLKAPEWILGKALPYILLGLVQFAVCFVAGVFIFGYRIPEHPLPLIAGGALYIAAAVFYGMIVGNVTGTQSAAIQAVQFGAFLLSMMLSGFLMPVENIPSGLRWISNFVPARHFIEVTRDVMLRGGGWVTSARPLFALAALLFFFFLSNVRRMRRMRLDS